MDPRTMTGLDLLRAMAAGDLPRASISETVPMDITAIDHGRIAMTARADDRHLNPLGGVHGGFAATVLDSVTGCAVHSVLEAGVGYGTIDLHVKMLHPVPRDADLLAEAHVTHVSRTIATAEGTLKTADGKLLASATATCMILRGRA